MPDAGALLCPTCRCVVQFAQLSREGSVYDGVICPFGHWWTFEVFEFLIAQRYGDNAIENYFG